MGRRSRLTLPHNGRARPRSLRRATILVTSATLALGLSSMPALGAPAKPEQPGNSGSQATANAPEAGKNAADDVNVLVFHGPAAEQNDPVVKATDAIEELGAANGFTVEESTDPAVFSDKNLDKYRGVVFLSAKGTELTTGQEDALEGYIKDGGGFLGVS